MADAEAEQWQPEAEEEHPETTSKPITDDFDVSNILKFDDIGYNDDGTTSRKHENLYETNTSEEETEEIFNNFGEVVEEETVVLEFEKVKPKLAINSMHCPNCNSEITQVILRRKEIGYGPTGPDLIELEPVQKDLVGCCSCLSLFTCSEDGCFNPFDVFRRRPENSNVHAVRENESRFRMFWTVGKVQKDLKQEDPPLPDPVLHYTPKYVTWNNPKLEDYQLPEPLFMNRESILSFGQVHAPKYVTENNPKLEDYPQIEPLFVNRQSIINFGQVQAPKFVTQTTSIPKDPFQLISLDLPESSNARRDDNTSIFIENAPGPIVVAQPRGRSWVGYEGVLVEILKSIVYGGLMEVIASFNVVVSAAASYATALTIVSVALASLIGGVFIIGHNLWDLRNDCYKSTSNQETNESASNKYKEQLGQLNHFPLHAFIAILSFLVFGMVPPVTYGYSFYKTDYTDFSLVMAAIATLLCVWLLSMIKAYINKYTVFEYFKTVVYYIVIAVLVSGVCYIVGNQAARLELKLGWFNTDSGGGNIPCIPRAIIPNLEAF